MKRVFAVLVIMAMLIGIMPATVLADNTRAVRGEISIVGNITNQLGEPITEENIGETTAVKFIAGLTNATMECASFVIAFYDRNGIMIGISENDVILYNGYNNGVSLNLTYDVSDAICYKIFVFEDMASIKSVTNVRNEYIEFKPLTEVVTTSFDNKIIEIKQKLVDGVVADYTAEELAAKIEEIITDETIFVANGAIEDAYATPTVDVPAVIADQSIGAEIIVAYTLSGASVNGRFDLTEDKIIKVRVVMAGNEIKDGSFTWALSTEKAQTSKRLSINVAYNAEYVGKTVAVVLTWDENTYELEEVVLPELEEDATSAEVVIEIGMLSAITAFKGISAGDVVNVALTVDGEAVEIEKDQITVATTSTGSSAGIPGGISGPVVAPKDEPAVDEPATERPNNYAYIINSAVSIDSWGGCCITVQVIADDGEVYEADLASTVKFVNFDEDEYSSLFTPTFAGKNASPTLGVKVKDIYNDGKLGKVADILKNRFIIYEANSSGQIKTVVVPGTDSGDELYIIDAGKNVTYYKSTKKFTGTDIRINNDTVVFYITNNSKSVIYGSGSSASLASWRLCEVTTTSTLANGVYPEVYGFDIDSNNKAKAIVILNTSSQI